MAEDTTGKRRGLRRAACLGGYFVWSRLLRRPVCTCRARLALAMWGAEVGKGLRVDGLLRLHIAGRLRIGARVSIRSGPANYVGGDRRMAIWVGKEGLLTIGDGCGLSNSTIVAMRQITLLPHTLIGGGCEIYDTEFHQLRPDERRGPEPVEKAPVSIGPRAFIGAFSIILKGVTIGEGAVVGAGSLVARDIPPFEIWAGRPARFLAKLRL